MKDLAHREPTIWVELIIIGLPWWLSGEESTCKFRSHRRRRIDPWVGKIPWRRNWQPTPVSWHGQRCLAGLQSMGSGSQRVRHNLATKQLLLLNFFKLPSEEGRQEGGVIGGPPEAPPHPTFLGRATEEGGGSLKSSQLPIVPIPWRVPFSLAKRGQRNTHF